MKRSLLALALALAVVPAGCGGGGPPAGESSASAPSAPTTTATPVPTSDPTPATPSPTGDPNPTATASTGGTTSPVPVPRILTPADDGRSYTMTEGQTAKLLVRDPEAADPAVEGTSVLVIAVVNVAASGQREWEVRAVGPGTSTIRGAGAHPYEITLVVGS